MIYLVNVIEHRVSTSPVPFQQGLLAPRMLSHLICLCLQTRKFTTCTVTSNSKPPDRPAAEQPWAKFSPASFGVTFVSEDTLVLLMYTKGSAEDSRFIWLLGSIKRQSSRFWCPEDWNMCSQLNSCLIQMSAAQSCV